MHYTDLPAPAWTINGVLPKPGRFYRKVLIFVHEFGQITRTSNKALCEFLHL